MSIVEKIKEYKKNHSSYNIAFYKDVENPESFPVSDFVVANQILLDSYYERATNQIGALISMPDTDVPIFPLIMYKCFANIYEKEDYSKSISESIQPGQLLRLYVDMPQRIVYNKNARRPAYTRYSKKEEDGSLVFTDINKEISVVDANLIDFFEIINQKEFPQMGSSKSQLELALDDVKITGITAENISKIRARKTLLKKSILYFCDKKEFENDCINLKKCGIYDREHIYKLNDALLIPTLVKEKNQLKLKYNDTYEEQRRQNEDYRLSVPAIVLSNQLHAIWEWSEKYPVDAIYVSTKKIEEFAMSEDGLLRLLFETCIEKDIRIIAFSETHQKRSEQRLLNMFPENITKVFQWSPDALAMLPSNNNASLYEKIETARNNAQNLTLSVYTSHFGQLSKALLRIRNKDNASVRPRLYERMADACKLITRSVCSIECIGKDLDELKNKIKKLSNNLEQYYGSDNPYQQDAACVVQMIDCFSYAKFKVLKEILSESNQNDKLVAIIVHEHVKEKTKEYFEDSQYTYVFSHTEFINDKQKDEFDIIVVSSYISTDKILYYLENIPTKDLRFIFYDVELNWFNRLLSREKNDGCLSLVDSDIAVDIFDDKNTDSVLSPVVQYYDTEETTQDSFEGNVFEDFDFWRSLQSRSWGCDNTEAEETENSENNNELLDCIELVFSNDSVMYCLPGRKVLKITDLSGSSKSIKPIFASEIKENDILIVRKTDRDIYTEIADGILKKENKKGLREFVSRWQTLLEKAVNEYGIETVYNSFCEKGGRVSQVQMRNWYVGDTMCPSRRDDLTAVLNAICELSNNDEDARKCLENVDKIFDAGRYIDNIHRHKVPKIIQDILKRSFEELMNIFNSYEKSGTIEEIGEVSILIVDEVNEGQQFKNRMMKLFEID